MPQTSMKSHRQFSWVVPESWVEKENSWFWLSVTAHASVRSEPSWPKNKWLPLHSKWSWKRLPMTLENSASSRQSQSFLSFLSVLQFKKESQENGIQARISLKFWAILFWLLPSLSLLFLKVCLWLLPYHWPSRSKRCLTIKTWSERWKPAKPWVEPTTFARIKLVPSPWTRWLWPLCGMVHWKKLMSTTRTLKFKTLLKIKNSSSCSKLQPVSMEPLSWDLKKRVQPLKLPS